jgi:prevent-host-death family protein
MRRAPIKNRLSAYLKRVRAGETVLILDRNEPIARLERVEAAAHPYDRLARLERAGLLRRASGPVSVDRLREAPPETGRSVLEALLEERREGR